MKTVVVFMASMMLSSAVALVWAQGATHEVTALWPVTELRKVTRTELVPQAKTPGSDGARVGSKTLMNVSTHTIAIGHRENAGVPELHTAVTDVIVVQDGGGVLQVGGEIVDRKDTPGGATGSSIRGGENYKLAAGDVMNIPPNTAHGWHLEAGEHVTYLVVKVKASDVRGR